MSETAAAARKIQRSVRQLTATIVATVLCGVLATVVSIAYTGWSNDQQDAKMCRLLHFVERPNPPPPADEHERLAREAFAQYKRDIHCK